MARRFGANVTIDPRDDDPVAAIKRQSATGRCAEGGAPPGWGQSRGATGRCERRRTVSVSHPCENAGTGAEVRGLHDLCHSGRDCPRGMLHTTRQYPSAGSRRLESVMNRHRVLLPVFLVVALMVLLATTGRAQVGQGLADLNSVPEATLARLPGMTPRSPKRSSPPGRSRRSSKPTRSCSVRS